MCFGRTIEGIIDHPMRCMSYGPFDCGGSVRTVAVSISGKSCMALPLGCGVDEGDVDGKKREQVSKKDTNWVSYAPPRPPWHGEVDVNGRKGEQ
jgi:hypothetical protein